VKDGEEVSGIEGTRESLVFDTAFVGLLLAKQTQRQSPNCSQVGRPVSILLPSRILAKGNV